VQQLKHMKYPGERRQSARFEIEGVARFRWKTADGNWHEGSGVTRNISRAGVFIACPTGPPVASQLHVVVTLAADWTNEVELRLCGFGDVRHRRNDAVAGGVGVSVIFRTEAAAAACQAGGQLPGP
jgi:hypothetical protein